MKRILAIISCLVILTYAGIGQASLVLDQEVDEGNTSFGVDELFAQSFTVGISGMLKAIEVVASGTSDGSIKFSVGLVRASQDGIPPDDWENELLFYESYTIDNNPYREWYRFDFPPVKVVEGEQFFIILQNDPSNLGVGHVSTRGYFYDSSLPFQDRYPAGKLWIRLSSDPWELYRDLGADMAFRTYVEPAKPPLKPDNAGLPGCLAEVAELQSMAFVPQTGQILSYAGGDDGALQKGVVCDEPRFTDNGDGTVSDNCTGLIWLRDANCFTPRTWSEALSDSNTLGDGHCGLTDGSSAGNWRLPNIRELLSIIDFSRINPALPAGYPFINVVFSDYWASTTYADDTSRAWRICMHCAHTETDWKTDHHYVWPVRGGS